MGFQWIRWQGRLPLSEPKESTFAQAKTVPLIEEPEDFSNKRSVFPSKRSAFSDEPEPFCYDRWPTTGNGNHFFLKQA